MNKILGTPGVEIAGVKTATYGPKDRDNFEADCRTLGLSTFSDTDTVVVTVNGQRTGEFDNKVGGMLAWAV